MRFRKGMKVECLEKPKGHPIKKGEIGTVELISPKGLLLVSWENDTTILTGDEIGFKFHESS